MSLDWYIGNVKNWKQKAKKYPGDLGTLIWKCLSLGIPKITEKNYKLFYQRYCQYREVSLNEVEKQYCKKLKLIDIKRWIGLFTNADTLSDKQFQKKIERMAK